MMSFDVLIRNVTVVDGTGGRPFVSDIGIVGDRIAEVGFIPNEADRNCKLVIDADGLVASPGFIDVHGHSDYELLVNRHCESKVMQGITTEICGNCGFSAAPILKGSIREQTEMWLQRMGIEVRWSKLSDFLNILEEGGLGLNIATLVGHNSLRSSVMGDDAREPSLEEMETMKALLAEALEQGAFGLSSGLIYPPGCFSQPDELVELCKVVRHYNGVYATHIRNESYDLIEAVHEAIDVARQTAVSVQVSHHKAVGKENWGKVGTTLQMIEQANEGGLNVTCDMYPYTATSTTLKMLLPKWAHSGGTKALLERLNDPDALMLMRMEVEKRFATEDDWAQVMISETVNEELKSFEGMRLNEVATVLGKKPFEALVHLLREDNARTTMICFTLSEEDVAQVIRYHRTMIGTDSSVRKLSPSGEAGKPHPRGFGTFPRILGRYVRDTGALTLTEAVRKMTSLAASKFGISCRGELREGYFADIVVFDPMLVNDTSTFRQPYSAPVGIKHVFVNGVAVVYDGKFTSALPGRVLYRS
jgi:N-acyl-D-amino-acid deacylase